MARSRRSAEAATELVRHEWAGRIEAEYRSAAITQQTVLWMLQIGASPDLIRDGLRIVDDELVHAELSHAVWRRAGGKGSPRIDRASLGLERTRAPLEHDLIDAVVKVFCLGETVAVRLFANLRRGAKVPVARRCLDRILRDEVRHRDFGWTSLTWLLQRPDAEELRSVVRAGLPAWIRNLEKNYGDGLPDGIREVTHAERAWGVAPWSEYRAILHETYERDYRRRFAKLGIEM